MAHVFVAQLKIETRFICRSSWDFTSTQESGFVASCSIGPVIIIRSVLFMATFSQWARWGSENGNELYLAITESLLRNNSSAAALRHSTLQYCSVIGNWVSSNRFWMRSDIRGELQRSDLSTESSFTSDVRVFISLVEICHCPIAKPGCVGFPQHSQRVSQTRLRFSS